MAEAHRWTRLTAIVLGALVAGIVGANVGSWVAGRGSGPLPGDDEALRLAREILPRVTAVAEIDRRDYLYGSPLGDEEYGPGYVEISYGGHSGAADPDCGHDRPARDRAAELGWEDPREITGYPCTSWNVSRGDLVMAYTHQGSSPVITFYRSTTWSTAGALIGALAGILAAAALFRPPTRRPLVAVAVLAPPLLLLLPVTVIMIVAVTGGGIEGPAPQLWSAWPALARLFL
jgi:hypothetical protein